MNNKSFRAERHDFIDRMIREIHSMPINQVIETRVPLPRRSGQSFQGICPFHRASHYGAFQVTPSKGIWKCFACGDGFAGDAIKFVSLYDGINWLDAVFKIAEEFNLASVDELQRYSKGNNAAESKRLERQYQPKAKTNKVQRADVKICDMAYDILADMSPLTDEQRTYLKEVRQLPEERFVDYFNFPSNWKLKDKIVEACLKAGIDTDDLLRVPGFYFDKKRDCISFGGCKGIGIKIHNAFLQTTGIQIRRMELKDGQSRYTWLSSSFALDEPDKYSGGASCGSQKDVLFPYASAGNNGNVCITEGRFKSERIVSTGNMCISVQGVSTWRGIENTVRDIEKTHWVKQFFVMFDADMFLNKGVFTHSLNMAKALARQFPDKPVSYIVWPEELGKGIDDLLIAGNGRYLKKMSVDDVEKKYNKVYDGVLKAFGVNDIKEVPDERLKIFEGTLLHRMEKEMLGYEG